MFPRILLVLLVLPEVAALQLEVQLDLQVPHRDVKRVALELDVRQRVSQFGNEFSLLRRRPPTSAVERLQLRHCDVKKCCPRPTIGELNGTAVPTSTVLGFRTREGKRVRLRVSDADVDALSQEINQDVDYDQIEQTLQPIFQSTPSVTQRRSKRSGRKLGDSRQSPDSKFKDVFDLVRTKGRHAVKVEGGSCFTTVTSCEEASQDDTDANIFSDSETLI